MAKVASRNKDVKKPVSPDSQVEVQSQIVQINILGVQIAVNEAGAEPAECSFEIAVNHRFQFDLNMVSVVLRITMHHDPPMEPLAVVTIECKFFMNILNDIVIREPLLKLPDDITDAINGVSISTSRGVLFGILRGTPLQGIVMPMIDISSKRRMLRDTGPVAA